MAIGPHSLELDFADILKHFENLIDVRLKEKILYSGAVSIDKPDGLDVVIFEHLRPLYLNAGWKSVMWYSDERYVDRLIFTKNEILDSIDEV
jgi:hypothetical protein